MASYSVLKSADVSERKLYVTGRLCLCKPSAHWVETPKEFCPVTQKKLHKLVKNTRKGGRELGISTLGSQDTRVRLQTVGIASLGSPRAPVGLSNKSVMGHHCAAIITKSRSAY